MAIRQQKGTRFMDASKVIVITGASDGVGAAAARSLAKAGHQVVLAGRSPEKTKRVAAEPGADSHIADFADLGAVRALAATVQAKYPRIDVLANNAGESPPPGPGRSPSTGTSGRFRCTTSRRSC